MSMSPSFVVTWIWNAMTNDYMTGNIDIKLKAFIAFKPPSHLAGMKQNQPELTIFKIRDNWVGLRSDCILVAFERLSTVSDCT